jgi:hypothetical protein
MAQVVEHLPSKLKALSSNSIPQNKRKKKKQAYETQSKQKKGNDKQAKVNKTEKGKMEINEIKNRIFKINKTIKLLSTLTVKIF